MKISIPAHCCKTNFIKYFLIEEPSGTFLNANYLRFMEGWFLQEVILVKWLGTFPTFEVIIHIYSSIVYVHLDEKAHPTLSDHISWHARRIFKRCCTVGYIQSIPIIYEG